MTRDPIDEFEAQLLEEERTAISRRKLFQEFKHLPKEKRRSFLTNAGEVLTLQEAFEAEAAKAKSEESESK